MTDAELLSEAHRIKAARDIALKMETDSLVVTDGDTDAEDGGYWVPTSLFISSDAIDAHMIDCNPDYLEDRMEAWKGTLK